MVPDLFRRAVSLTALSSLISFHIILSGCGDPGRGTSGTPQENVQPDARPAPDAPIAAQRTADPVSLLKALLKDRQARVAAASPVYFNKHTKGWAKRKMSLDDIIYDVQKTNSLVTPYLGIVNFKVYLRQTPFFPTGEEAKASGSFGEADDGRACRATYGFQEGKWTLKKCEYHVVDDQWFTLKPDEDPSTWPASALVLLK